MNQSLKLLAALLALATPAVLAAQELHAFSNGEVADADKINENFNLLEGLIASYQGSTPSCTATQKNNTATIECPDGSRAAVTGYGSIIVFPDGVEGELPAIDVSLGKVVVLDSNNQILGEADGISTPGNSFDMSVRAGERDFTIVIRNNVAEQKVDLSATSSWTLYYTDENCSNGPFGSTFRIYDLGGSFMVAAGENLGKLLFKSQRESAYISSYNDTKYAMTDCVARDEIREFNYSLTEYRLADEIVNAAYPVRVEQLP